MLRTLLAGSAVLLSACSATAQTLPAPPVESVRTGAFQDPDLRESSGVARSRLLPRILFTINDSGNEPIIFATDSSGRPIGRWLIPGTRNRDWEAIAVGTCPAGSCIYVGDTGDNRERKKFVTIYRVREPARLERFRGAADPTPIDLDTLQLRYPDGPHDTEAMWVDGDGALSLVTKGRTGGILLFRVPAAAWEAHGTITATRIQQLPITPDQAAGRWVTDAALAPDGSRVAIRTYTEIYFFPVLPAGRLGTPTSRCNVAGLEPQGEGVDWLDSARLILTSEAPFPAMAGPIHVIRCGA
ncbi:MAG: hypothetical protein ABI587_03715 [Gemmatimonadales bacterium]